MKRSNIGWTDYSGGDLNFVVRGRAEGDCEVSPGCAHCYAAAIVRRSKQTPERTRVYPEKLARLRNWQPVAGDVPFRRGVDAAPMAFVCDMGDLFHDDIATAFIVDALAIMAEKREITWQVLTKRAERMHALIEATWTRPPANIWLGVTAENQALADERIPLLLRTPAARRFVSMEPLLGPISLYPFCGAWCAVCGWHQTNVSQVDRALATPLHSNNFCSRCGSVLSLAHAGLHWVIVGAESGPKRRPFSPKWATDIHAQCRDVGVAFLGKQDSGLHPGVPLLIEDLNEVKEFP